MKVFTCILLQVRNTNSEAQKNVRCDINIIKKYPSQTNTQIHVAHSSTYLDNRSLRREKFSSKSCKCVMELSSSHYFHENRSPQDDPNRAVQRQSRSRQILVRALQVTDATFPNVLFCSCTYPSLVCKCSVLLTRCTFRNYCTRDCWVDQL